MKGSKHAVYLSPVRHRETKTIYRNGYFEKGKWHVVNKAGETFIFNAVECEFVFQGPLKKAQ